MDDRTRASLLWGAVSGLSLLVLVQAHRLLGGAPVDVPVVAGAAVVAAVGGAALAHAAGRRLGGGRNQSP